MTKRERERVEMTYDLKEMQPLIPSIVVGRAIKPKEKNPIVLKAFI